MSVPVVCSDADGLSENVSDGETGFVVPRRDPTAQADKLAILASDADLRRRFGSAGRERALSHFQIADQIRAFENLYSVVIADRASGSGRPTNPDFSPQKLKELRLMVEVSCSTTTYTVRRSSFGRDTV